MLSHSGQRNSWQTFKQAHNHKPHRNQLIQLLAGSCTIAALGFLFFKSVQTFPIVFSQNDGPISILSHAHPLSKRLTHTEITDSPINLFDLRTELYDLEGNLVGSFPGEFQDTTPDDQGVITYLYSAGHSYLSPLDGTKPRALEGVFQEFSPGDRHIITYSQTQSYLYDHDGTLVMRLDGLLKWGTLDGQYLVTETKNGLAFNLYRANGEIQAVYEGIFRGFSLHTPHLVTTDSARASYLYNFDGSLVSTFEGSFQGFRPVEEGLVTLTYSPSRLPGHPMERPPALSSQSHLYNLDGILQASFTGEFTAFTPDDRSLFTYQNGALYLYSLDSLGSGADFIHESQTYFEGMLLGITGNAQQLVTANALQSSLNPKSWLYSIDGTKLADLDGIFIGFISNEQRMVTSSTGVEGMLGLVHSIYRLYDLSGNLKATMTGQLLGLTQSGRQGLVIYAEGKTRLYDSWDGTEQAVFEGRALGLTRDETGIFMPTATPVERELTID